MQSELNPFFRILRINWLFRDQSDKRSDLEKVFYQKSNWQPPKACVEVERFISRIQDSFVSLDVVSMYTNMTEEMGTSASKDYLQSRGSQVGVGHCPEELKVKTESILSALELCIRNNFFKFNSKIYKQTEGVGTGIKLAPPFACLGMGKYEELVFQSDQELTKLIL